VASLTRRAWIFAEFGKFSEAVNYGAEAVRIADVINHPASLMEAYTGLGLVYVRRGDAEKLVKILASLEGLANIYREPTYFHMIAAFLGSAYAMCGRVADSLAVLEEAIEQSIATKLMARHTIILVALGESYLLANRLIEANDCANRALRRSEECDERGNQAYAHRLMGELAVASDPVDEVDAREHYGHSLTLAESLTMQPLKAHGRLGLARLFHKIGRVGSAREELAAAVDLYSSMTMPLWLSQAETVAKHLKLREQRPRVD
jgi:tetratricopeptide (TPR) repeat protein